LTQTLMRERKADLPWMIGDISCDIDGSLECTLDASSIDEPDFTYNVDLRTISPGHSWEGPTIMAIDNLPCELPRDASEYFSACMLPFLPELMTMDSSKSLAESGLSETMQRAVIVYRGELTERFRYLQQHLDLAASKGAAAVNA
jgi:saccharopine dehydrogenase (NAD+, L-lysine-forming)